MFIPTADAYELAFLWVMLVLISHWIGWLVGYLEAKKKWWRIGWFSCQADPHHDEPPDPPGMR